MAETNINPPAPWMPPAKRNYTLAVNGQKVSIVLSIPKDIPTAEALDAYVEFELREVLLLACRKRFGPGRLIPVHGDNKSFIWVTPPCLPVVEWKK